LPDEVPCGGADERLDELPSSLSSSSSSSSLWVCDFFLAAVFVFFPAGSVAERVRLARGVPGRGPEPLPPRLDVEGFLLLALAPRFELEALGGMLSAMDDRGVLQRLSKVRQGKEDEKELES
jgi:hypothetical protein